LPLLFGERDRFLSRIQDALNITIAARGNNVLLTGLEAQVVMGSSVLNHLYDRLKQGNIITNSDVDGALRFCQSQPKDKHFSPSSVSVATRKRIVTPRTAAQQEYLNAMEKHDLVFALGPAGTGKTYLAVAMGVSMLLSKTVDRIILSRPAVEAGEKLGFLPGDMREKVDPYLRPLYDALYDMLPDEHVSRRMESGEIEVAPLAFMRGRTLSRAFVILDEAQNTTEEQMKMFLTRLGEGSRMVISGDLTQIDLPYGVRSGLKDAVTLLKDVEGLCISTFTSADVMRHPLVGRIVNAYENKIQ
jgi:phosphate starvation-inducible PhoH-like protein